VNKQQTSCNCEVNEEGSGACLKFAVTTGFSVGFGIVFGALQYHTTLGTQINEDMSKNLWISLNHPSLSFHKIKQTPTTTYYNIS